METNGAMRRGIVRREITPGMRQPQGWRVAWFDLRRHVLVCYPAPLHWLARAMREIEWRARLVLHAPGRTGQELQQAQREHRERQKMAEEYARGYLEGWRECFEACAELLDGGARDAGN